VIEKFSFVDEEHCRLRCYLEKSCLSYNYGPSKGNVFRCELNNADSFSHPADLIERNGWVYQTAEVIKLDYLQRNTPLLT